MEKKTKTTKRLTRFVSVLLAMMMCLSLFTSCSLKNLQGEAGKQGEQGTVIERTYINSEFHLILVLADGREIDAGYIGGIDTHTVTFDWNCEEESLSTPVTAVTLDGALLTLPKIPERDRSVFLGWYKDKECTEMFNLSAPISEDTTVYAGWRPFSYEDILERQVEELENLKELNDGELPEILLDKNTYAPAFILGTYSDKKVTDFNSALASLKDVKNLMGFCNLEEEYVELSSFTFKGTTQYRMQQMYNGYTVYGQQLIVTANENGEVTSLSGDYATIGTLFNPAVNITVEEALAVAEEYSNFDSTNATLVVYTLDGYNEMAYVFDNDAYTAIVSADDGTILSSGTKVMTALPSTTAGDTITSTIGRNEEGDTFNTAYIDYIDPTKQDTYVFYDTVRNIIYHDLGMTNDHDWDNLSKKSSLTDNDNIWTSDATEKVISLSNNLSKTYDFYLDVLGLMSYDGNGGQIFAYVNDAWSSGTNAFNWGPRTFNGTATTLIGFGGVANHQDNLDVVAHEFTHAVQGGLVGLVYQNESGALMEAYADVMGELIELYVTGSTDWKHNDRNIKQPSSFFIRLIDERTNGIFNLVFPEKLNGVGYFDATWNWFTLLEVLEGPGDAFNEQSIFVHHNSTVISHAIYNMYDRGLNNVRVLTELLYRAWGYLTNVATFHDYRLAMLAAANDMGLNEAEIGYIADAFDAANITPETIPNDYDHTWSTADVILTVVDSLDNTAISNARIVVKALDGTTVSEVYSDENGHIHINLRQGTYIARIIAVGYEFHDVNYNLAPQQTIENTIRLNKYTYQDVPVVYEVGGRVTDAVKGDEVAVAGVTMKFRKGYNITSGRFIDPPITTDENGEYYTNALTEPGYYTVELSKDGYITSYVIVQVAANWENSDHEHENVLSQNFSISPMVQQGGTLRIVLTWGAAPSDLDSHLFGTSTTGRSYHVYYSDKIASENGERIAELDIDDVTSFGPETITVDLKKQDGMIHYYVHDYSTYSSAYSMALASSGAIIQVYSDNSLIATYNVPTTQAGTVWHVFDYDPSTGRIIPINTFGSEAIDE